MSIVLVNRGLGKEHVVAAGQEVRPPVVDFPLFTVRCRELLRCAPLRRGGDYERFDLDWRWVQSAIREAFTDDDRRKAMRESANIFRVLIKTLLKAGIITERTAPIYAAWVDMKELADERDEVVGVEIAEAAIAELREVNRARKKIGKALRYS